MHADEIMKTAKKNKFPDQGSYKPAHSLVEARTTGCFSLKSDRCGYLEEAGVIGKEKPVVKGDSNFKLVEHKTLTTTMYKPSPPKKIVKTSLSPTSYENLHSYKNTQIKKPNVYISKYKNDNFISIAVKHNKWKLGTGHYD